MRYLVLFTYYETNESKLNLYFFLKNGVFRSNMITYIFIIKGNKLSVKIPKFNNVIVQKTLNEGYDFGGWSDGLKLVNLNNYDRFIFLNDTVRGPFLPTYLNKKDWVRHFTTFINNKVKLVGSTINRNKIYYRKIKNDHIQSMSFATDKIGLDLLIKNNIFNKKLCIDKMKESKWNYISEFEIRMSEIILNNGYNIKSLQFCEIKVDPQHLFFYNWTTINPLEIMFIKTNRINNKIVQNYSKWNLPNNKKLNYIVEKNNKKKRLFLIIVILIVFLLAFKIFMNT